MNYRYQIFIVEDQSHTVQRRRVVQRAFVYHVGCQVRHVFNVQAICVVELSEMILEFFEYER